MRAVRFLLCAVAVVLPSEAKAQFRLPTTNSGGGTSSATTISGALYCADAGATDTYACDLSPAITSYTAGLQACFKANTANTTASSINFNSLGALTIKRMTSVLTTDTFTGDILAGQIVCGVYDGTNFMMLGEYPGQLFAVGGSVGTPSLRFTDADTGLYEFTSGQVTVTTNGAARWTFSDTGSVATQPVQFGAAVNSPDLILARQGAAIFQLGADINGTGTSQTITGPRGITGSDRVGGNLTLQGGVGTGAGLGTQVNLNRNVALATGTTQQSSVNAFTSCESKILSNTTGTATALVNITLPNNSAGAARATVSVQCNDGTNFDSDIVTSYVAYVNKAGTLTFGTPVTTGTAAANNSGSCTVAPTWVANGTTSVDFKVTPVITTIAPTTTTGVVNLENLGGVQGGGGVVTCK